jgi:FKBP-type peptidyl-prolyl cis-trans isomerase SlyD
MARHFQPSPAFQVGPETTLTLSYRVFDAEGELIEEMRDRTVVFGHATLLPAVERALDGCSAGATRSVKLSPHEAFGPRHPDRIIDVDRTEFPADAQPGDRFLAETDGGEPLVLTVLELHDDTARIDTNHPLAGQAVRVELELLDVRPATLIELDTARIRMAAATTLGPAESLIAPERLLRGPTRRYDSADPAVERTGSPDAPAALLSGDPTKPNIA